MSKKKKIFRKKRKNGDVFSNAIASYWEKRRDKEDKRKRKKKWLENNRLTGVESTYGIPHPKKKP